MGCGVTLLAAQRQGAQTGVAGLAKRRTLAARARDPATAGP